MPKQAHPLTPSAVANAKPKAEPKAMMQAWADYLDTLRDETRKVVPIKRKA